jgi:hypothetical protein
VKKFLTITVTVAVLLALLPLLLYLLGVAVNLTFLAIEVTGILIFLVGMPLFFWIMGEAGYKVFLRPFVRAHRIRTIRNRRLLREAVERRNNSFE